MNEVFIPATVEKEYVECDKEVELVGYVASGCTGLAHREYQRRHHWMGLKVYWDLRQKYLVKWADVWNKEVPDDVRVSEDGNVEIW